MKIILTSEDDLPLWDIQTVTQNLTAPKSRNKKRKNYDGLQKVYNKKNQNLPAPKYHRL